MNILVYGAGGIGLYLSARLSLAGHSVTLKGRSTTVEAFNDAPLTLVHERERVIAPEVTVVERLDRTPGFDLAIIATKAWQVAEAAAEICHVLTEDGRVLTTQNGVDAPPRSAAHIPAAQVLAGTILVVAQRLDARTVELVGAQARMTVGSLERTHTEDQDRAVLAALQHSNITATWTPNPRSALWKKLALIASYGGVGALSGATVGQTRSVPETADLVKGAMREVIAVGNAEGAELGESDLSDIVAMYQNGFHPETTASMQRDLAEGRPSELGDQNGAVVAHAASAGIPVPLHQTIYASQLPRELAARNKEPR